MFECFYDILPKQEDIEWHPNWISLFTDPDCFQDPRVAQLAADQVVLKHAWLLSRNRQQLGSTFQNTSSVRDQNQCLQIYLHAIWLNAANEKGVAPRTKGGK